MANDGAKSSASGRNLGDVVAGRYRITGVVGKGAMGAVYAAEHTATGQKVALKFMIVGDDEDKEFIARFEQEAKVMAGLRSTNTIRIYDFGRADDGALFMAMELLVGKPLDKHLRDLAREGKAMTEQEAGRLTSQILRSLTEAHGLGLVHRDMKPGNVFLNDDGGDDVIAKVLDFGLARVGNSALTNVGRIMGTPAYMAPEQWQGAAVKPPADLYAVGCMMYAMVTGEPPYQAGDNVLSLMHKHCTEDIPDPRAAARVRLSDGYVAVMTKAMAKKAADRYQEAKAMRQAIEAVLGGSWTSHTNLGTAPKGEATTPYVHDSNPKVSDSKRAVVRSPSGAATADSETMASDVALAARQSQRQVGLGQDPSADATIAVPPPGHKSNVAVGQRSSTYIGDPGTDAAVPAAKSKTGLVIGAVAGLVAIAVGGWFATRPAPGAPAPVADTAPAVAPVEAAAPAAPTMLPPAPALAAPVAPAAAPVAPAAQAPDAATPAPASAVASAPDAGAAAVAPAEPAKAAAPPRPKAAKPAAPKKKAQGYETVD